MADKRWVSTTGDLGAVASYDPSGVPIDLDSLYFDGSSNQDAHTSMSTFSAITITRFWAQPPFQGDIGANGNPILMTAKQLVHQGSGSVYHDHPAVSGPSYIVIDSPNLQDAYTLTATGGAGGLDATWSVVNGRMIVLDNSSSVLGTLLVGPGRLAAPIVDIGKINTVADYRQSGGFVTTKTPLAANLSTSRAIIDGGTLVYHKDATTTLPWTKMAITGGRVEYNGVGVSGGVHMTECVLASGILDMTKDSRAKTISKLIILPGGVFLTHKNITVTTLIDLRGSYPILP